MWFTLLSCVVHTVELCGSHCRVVCVHNVELFVVHTVDLVAELLVVAFSH